MGFYTQVEYHTSNGRIDLVLQTPDYIYVMEFKLHGTAEEALQQINEKGYALPFEKDPRTLYKIGVSFSPETRNIDTWVVEWEWRTKSKEWKRDGRAMKERFESWRAKI